MVIPKALLVFSLYIAYKFAAYFFSFVESGFPAWGEKVAIGNATYSLFFAPYGAIIGFSMVSTLVYTSGKDVFRYYLSNETTLAKVTLIEHATDDTSKGAPINIRVNFNGVNVTYDFAPPYYQEMISAGDQISVKYRKGHEHNSILDEKKIDSQYKTFKLNNPSS